MSFLVLAAQAKRDIDASHGRLGGEGVVTASRVISIGNICMSVVMVPLMLAIAIPTFLAAQDRAQGRMVQSELRSAMSAERVRFSDNQRWTDDPAALAALEPTLQFERGDTPTRADVVYVTVEGQLVGLAGMTQSGDCYYVMSDASQTNTLYAQDPDCGRIQEQDYGDVWE